jgi:hypothetical protein
MPDWQRFLHGMAGAASPEVIRWSRAALHPQIADLPTSWPIYLLTTVIFFGFGGFFATLWEDNSPIKCFYFGVTFPPFVSAMLAGYPKLPGLG